MTKDSLLRRNIGLLVGVVLAGQLLAGLLVVTLVLRPQTIRAAEISARMLNALSVVMENADPLEESRIIAQINEDGSIQLRLSHDPPSADGRAYPTFLDRMFMRALAERLSSQEALVWRTDRSNRLWMEVHLGGQPYWVSLSPTRVGGPLVSLVIALLVAFLVAMVGGLFLQRRLDRPLRALAQSLAGFRPGSAPSRIAVEGPREIASVAHALNDMADRIAQHEEERALMLAGVSHDLRTPLARLRLSVELMRDPDQELRDSAARQIEQIDHMLGQFLDLARNTGEQRRVVSLHELLISAAEDAGMVDSVTIDAPPRATAQLHPLGMRRAIKNLLENAARHGRPPIILRARQESNGLRIEVIDRGAGFDPTLTEHFLKPFAKADTARGGDSTGLGLSIASKGVAGEDGRIVFEQSAEGFIAAMILPQRGPD